MKTGDMTLSQFFPSGTGDTSAQLLTETGKDEELAPLKENISSRIAGIGWPVALGEILKKGTELLDISIIDIIIGGWNTYGTLRKYTDRKKYPPDQTLLVPLADHTIKSEHHPFIEVLIDGDAVGKVVFDIELALKIQGLIMKVQDGKIKEIRIAACKGQGSVKHGKLVILEREMKTLTLPASIGLGEGIPISV